MFRFEFRDSACVPRSRKKAAKELPTVSSIELAARHWLTVRVSGVANSAGDDGRSAPSDPLAITAPPTSPRTPMVAAESPIAVRRERSASTLSRSIMPHPKNLAPPQRGLLRHGLLRSLAISSASKQKAPPLGRNGAQDVCGGIRMARMSVRGGVTLLRTIDPHTCRTSPKSGRWAVPPLHLKRPSARS